MIMHSQGSNMILVEFELRQLSSSFSLILFQLCVSYLVPPPPYPPTPST
jgi:hypothetical protein